LPRSGPKGENCFSVPTWRGGGGEVKREIALPFAHESGEGALFIIAREGEKKGFISEAARKKKEEEDRNSRQQAKKKISSIFFR